MPRFTQMGSPLLRSITIIDTERHLHDGRRYHERPQYQPYEAQVVCDWLNGQDTPILLVARIDDPFDPGNRFPNRVSRYLGPR